MGKYLNFLMFSESQLSLRFFDLTTSQNQCKNTIKALALEISEIKAKYKDSEFIQN